MSGRSFILLLVFFAQVHADCEDGWFYNSRALKCVKIIEVQSPWEEADYTCTTLGARLMTIKSDEEHEWMIDFLSRHVRSLPQYIWLGIRPTTTCEFRWVDDSPVEYSRFSSKEALDGCSTAFGMKYCFQVLASKPDSRLGSDWEMTGWDPEVTSWTCSDTHNSFVCEVPA